jgi:hypothetical protein
MLKVFPLLCPAHRGLWLTLLLLAPAAVPAMTNYVHGDPTPLEQFMLEHINRARLNPAAEGLRLNALDTAYSRSARLRKPEFFTNLVAEFAAYPPVPPLTFHPLLHQAAGAHAQDMIDRGYFSHNTPENLAPADRVAALGYDAGVGENLDGGGAGTAAEVLESHFSLMVDHDNAAHAEAPLGHRLNVLEATYREVGVGIRGPRFGGKVAQDFGNAARNYLLGVAYTDTNGDGFYTPGEGLAGVTVTPDRGNHYAVTSASGGFALPVEALETLTNNVPVPLAIGPDSWNEVEPYDRAYREEQMQQAGLLTVKLTWTGGALTSPRVTYASLKRPVRHEYRLVGTNNWFYPRSFVTTESVKADLVTDPRVNVPGWELNAIYGWLWSGGDGWYYSSALGWTWFTEGWAYSSNLKGWLGQMGASRTLWSPQFGWLTLVANLDGSAQTSTLGRIWLGRYAGAAISEGWVVSDRFGYVWPVGDGRWFYSSASGWLGVTSDGGIWSVDLGRFL